MARKFASTEGVRWAFMKRFDVAWLHDPSVTYLTRWRVVQTPWFGLYLHRIRTPDSDRHLHNHPFGFLSFVLRGGYIEDVSPTVRDATHGVHDVHHRNPGSMHYMSRHFFHEITKVRPNTWTLLLVGARRQDWGFATEDGFVPHAEYFELQKAGPWS